MKSLEEHRLPLFLVLALLSLFSWRQGVLPAWRSINSDFPNYYVSARMVYLGEDLSLLYDDHRFAKRVAAAGIDEVGKFSTFPPCTALVMLPLAPFPPLVAKRLWTILNGCFLLLNVALLAALCARSRLEAALLVLLGGAALAANFKLGQCYLALSAMIIGALLCVRHGRPLWGGMLLGMGMSLKYLPVIYLPVWWAQRRYRAVAAAILTTLAITALELLLFGPVLWRRFISQTFLPHLDGNIPNQGEGYAVAFQSFNSLYRNLFVFHETYNPMPFINLPSLYAPAKWLTLALIGGTAGWFWYRLRRDPAEWKHIVLVGTTAMVLLPASATYHLLLLLPALALLVAECLRRGAHLGALWLSGLWALLGFFPFWRLNALPQTGLWIGFHYHRLWLLLTLWLSSLFILHALQKHPEVRPTP